ncbi:MAG: OmpA family protein [Spirochaeta sp.]|jgi:outer membrane protein OmpA-like peptidoglycan-associated protein|nr:OmpA family protein [Spirochaeta sp.]
MRRVSTETATAAIFFLLFTLGLAFLPAQSDRSASSSGNAEVQPRRFVHRYRPGEEYRIVGVNDQNLFVDNEPVGSAEVLTRIQIAVTALDQVADGVIGTLEAHYQVSEEADTGGGAFQLERSYSVEFTQDEAGRQTVARDSFVPQVRDIPTFPEREIAPGDTWSAPAVEVYDFREGLGIDEPVGIPVDVQYEYLGPREFEDRTYDVIRIRYNLFYRPPPARPEAQTIRVMTARFSQELYWDFLAGRAHYYEEDYTLFLQLADGTRSEYRGSADGRIVAAPPLDRDRLRDEIQGAIDSDGIDDTTVRSDEEGVTVSLENIRFAPDSAVLLDSEREKVRWLAEILGRYPDRDILVSGHTALAGTPQGRQMLSEERAAAVGEYLINLGARDRENIMYQGFGARRPVADNDTEAGRRRNRRVEITILEN